MKHKGESEVSNIYGRVGAVVSGVSVRAYGALSSPSGTKLNDDTLFLVLMTVS